MDRARRLLRATLVILVLVGFVALAWQSRDPAFLTGQDDLTYRALGQSLRHGDYREGYLVGAPVHALYPPAYPFLIAVWGAVAGDGYEALTALSIVLAGLALGVVYLTLRRSPEPGIALPALILLAVNPMMIRHGTAVMSEAPVLLFSALALWAAAGDVRVPSRSRAAVAIAAAVLTALSRTAGIVIVLALGCHWAIARRWRAIVGLGLACAFTVGPWLAWTALAPEQYTGTSYLAEARIGIGSVSWVTPLPERAILNLTSYARWALDSISVPHIGGTSLDNIVALLLVSVLVTVGAIAAWRWWRAGVLYLAGAGALLTVWTWAVPRFLVPLLLVLIPVLLTGTLALAGRRRWIGFVAVSVVTGVVGFRSGARDWAYAESQRRCRDSSGWPTAACLSEQKVGYFVALRYLRDSLPDGAVFLAAKYAPLHYYTGRRGVPYRPALARNSTALVDHLRAEGATYVLLGSLERSEPVRLAPTLREICRDLEMIRAFPPWTYLYRITEPTDDRAACESIDRYLAANAGREW